jgi:NhaA family Na+:H+ antiporter
LVTGKVVIRRSFSQFALFFHHAAEKGILLLVAAIAAIIIANSPFAAIYHHFLESNFAILSGAFAVKLSIHTWINDFLMAIFFFLVGMEIKREMLEGNLASRDQRILPVTAACFGVMVPAIIYCYFNARYSIGMRGWAIPSATDIAFAIGMLSLFGKDVPVTLRVFLTALAIIDDLIAIVIIACFYTKAFQINFIFYAVVILYFIKLLNKAGIIFIPLYITFGLLLWYCFLRSGIHATIAGVIMGLFIPLNHPFKKNYSPLIIIEKAIHPFVAYFVLPIFAFTNCGLDLSLLNLDMLTSSVTLGIVLGLFLGKQIGVFLPVYLLIKFKICSMPQKANFLQFYGIAILCGIGFTMSLFVGNLGFGNYLDYINQMQLGVLTGSLLSIIYGGIILSLASRITSGQKTHTKSLK